MSTILDALRKVERERDAPHDQLLESPTISVDRPRSFPVWVLVVGALVGFSGGGIIRWQRSAARPVEVAALPPALPAPAIAVPRAPAPAAPPLAPPPIAPAKEKPAIAAAPPAAPTAAEPPAERVPKDTVVGAVAPPPTEPAPGGLTAGASDKMLAALERNDSALEPSPFSPPRDIVPDAAGGVPTRAEPSAPSEAANAAPPAAEPSDAMLAAVAPRPEAEAPAPEAVPEPEPEASPESLFDTGRSPPGAPKVALSFLQWSADPARRFAFISIDGAPSQRVREGEVTSGMTVAAITPTGVQFKREGTSFMIRPRH